MILIGGLLRVHVICNTCARNTTACARIIYYVRTYYLLRARVIATACARISYYVRTY